MFKDGQSQGLSDMAQNAGKIEFSLWFRFAEQLPSEFWEKAFEIEVKNPKLCDGGYERIGWIISNNLKILARF